MEPEPFKALPEDWERALAIVAHPDDMEFGAAAAVARWTGQGKSIAYCMVTSGEAGIDGMPPDECRAVREAEQIASANVVGVYQVDFLGFQDGVIEYGVPLRRAIAQVVRGYRPDIVITGNFRDTWGGTNLNQADHIAVGRGVVDAVRDAGNRWIFNDQLTGDLQPWGGVKAVWAFGSPAGHPCRRHHRHLRFRRRVAQGARGVHRGTGLGELRRARVPRGLRPAGRPAARRTVRGAVRGVPDGLGRVALLDPCLVAGLPHGADSWSASGPSPSSS